MNRTSTVLVVVLLLAACQDPPPPPPEGDGEPVDAVVVHIWEKPGMAPLVLVADAARQEATAPDDVLLEGVRLRLPLRDGEVLLLTDAARIDLARGQTITLQPPVGFSGTFQDHALTGRAAEAVVHLDERRLVLVDVGLLFAAQELRVDRLTIHDDWRTRTAEKVRSRPAAVPVIAALATLPRPLDFASPAP
jgi:hypothetical protein